MKKFLLFSLLILSQMIWSQTATAPASGTGTFGDPYLIATLDNLYWIAADQTRWASHYRQTMDIDAAATSGWFSGAGWSPIGNSGTLFTGSYNGDGHIISNLTINRPAQDEIGLFGNTLNVTISNLGVANVSIQGANNVGGLIGNNYSSTVSNCYSTGSVSGDYTVGGFAGYSDGEVVSCYSTGSVIGEGGAGGFMGANDGIVGNCYSRANVSGTEYLGGLVGDNSGQIYNCYSTGLVSGSSYPVGGFVGSSPASDLNVQGCFWNTTTSNQSESGSPIDTEGATGKSTVQMTTGAHGIPNFYTNAYWDFKGESANGTNDVWNINNVRNDGYPFLSWQFPSDDPLPVELTSFTAEVTGSQVTLNWQTATEVNNYGFEVERSRKTDGGSQMPPAAEEWETIGFVKGSGNSNSVKEYSFTDLNLNLDLNLKYRLKQIDNDGSFTYSKEVEILNSTPSTLNLRQNYPNPFNPSTVISYQIPRDGYVTLKVYDMIGNEVATLVNGMQNSGTYYVTFDATGLTSGVYMYELRTNNFVSVKKLLLMK